MNFRNLTTALVLFVTVNTHGQTFPNFWMKSENTSNLIEFEGDEEPETEFHVYGSGGLQAAVTEADAQNTLGSGSIGLAFFNPSKFQGSVAFMLNSTNDPILFKEQKSFGGALAVPGVGSNSLYIDYRHFLHDKWGFSINVLGATGEWALNDTTKFTAAPISIKAQGSFVPFDKRDNENIKLMMAFDLGYSARILVGDVAQEDEFRMNTLGTKQTSFHGLELGFSFYLNDFRFFANLPILFGSDAVKGLTGAQFNIGMSVTGDLIKTKL